MAGFQLTLHGRIWVTPEDPCVVCLGVSSLFFIHDRMRLHAVANLSLANLHGERTLHAQATTKEEVEAVT
jgi:hypothetical protein